MRSQVPELLPHAAAASPREQAGHNRQVVASVQAQLVPVLMLEDVFQGDGLPGYIRGDVVGLPSAIAERLVSAGLASYDLGSKPRKVPRRPEIANGAPTAAAGGPVRMKLVRPWGTMMAGEVAGFNAELAHELAVKGIARREGAPSPLRRTLRDIRDALTGRR